MPVTITDLGTASLGFPLNGGTLAGDRLVVSSRNLVPPRLAVVDPVRRTVARGPEVASGSGAWALVALSPRRLVVAQSNARGDDVLFTVELEGGTVTPLAALDVDYVWAMVRAPDGRLACGTSPGPVRMVDPATGTVTDLGVVDARVTVRGMTVAGGRIIAGGAGLNGPLLQAFSADGSDNRDVAPAELASDGFVYAVGQGDGLIAAGTQGPASSSPAVAILDAASLTTLRVERLPPEESTVDSVTVARGAAWATARPSGALYRIDVAGGPAERVAVPVEGAETRALEVLGTMVVGVSAAARVWTHGLADAKTDVLDLLELGLPAGAEKSQSLSVGGDTVATGGNFGVQVRRIKDRATRRYFVSGEPKDQLVVGATRYLALYPFGELWAGPADLGTAPTRLVRFADQQNRPQVLAHAPQAGLVLCGTGSDFGGGGSLQIYDPRDGSLAPYVDVITPVQHVAGLTVDGDVAYLGGGGLHPTLVAFSLSARAEQWRLELGSELGSAVGLAVRNRELWVLAERGTLVVVDLDARTVLRRQQLAPRGGRLFRYGDGFTAADLDSLYDIAPSGERSDVVRALHSEIWGNPFLALRGDTRYVIRGTSLLEVADRASLGVDPALVRRADDLYHLFRRVRGARTLGT